MFVQLVSVIPLVFIVVVVTGASGFVGLHCVLACLQRGYAVRATVREAKKVAHNNSLCLII